MERDDNARQSLDTALQLALQANQIDPELTAASLLAGQAARQLALRFSTGDVRKSLFETALSPLISAAIAEPPHAHAFAELAALTLDTAPKDTAKAEQYYRQCLALSPESTFAARGLFRLLIRQGRHIEARSIGERLLQVMFPAAPEIVCNLASCLRLVEPVDLERAAEMLREFLLTDPTNVQALLELAQVWRAIGNPGACLLSLRKVYARGRIDPNLQSKAKKIEDRALDDIRRRDASLLSAFHKLESGNPSEDEVNNTLTTLRQAFSHDPVVAERLLVWSNKWAGTHAPGRRY